MGTITLPNLRTTADVTMNTRLKDGGVYVDWAGLTDIKAWLYSDAQRAIAGRCDVSISEADSTKLVCEYSASKPQYPGVQRLIIQATYMGATKTYDKPAFNFVRWTADQAGEQITIDDPEVYVTIEATDVSSSILQKAIAAALAAAEHAEHAASLVPLQVLQDCEEATADANQARDAANAAAAEATEAAGRAPYIGENGNWFIWNAELGEYVDSGVKGREDVDEELSESSANPVENRVVKAAIDEKYTKPENGVPKTDMVEEVQKAINFAAASASRPYDSQNPNGMGYLVLEKDKTFASQVTEANTIYEIRYDFVLTASFTMPTGCILRFVGGSISGAYTFTGTDTKIEAGKSKIFGTDIMIDGTWNVAESFPVWFGAAGDGITDDTAAIKNCFLLKCPVSLNGSYAINNTVRAYNSVNGNGSTIIYGANYYLSFQDIADFYVKDINIDGQNLSSRGLDFRNVQNVTIQNCTVENIGNATIAQVFAISFAMGSGCKNINISACRIKNVVYDNLGACGGIGFSNNVNEPEATANNGLYVSDCRFEGFNTSTEDSDCIKVLSDNGLDTNVVITGCFFTGIGKRAVKTQARGCKLIGNTYEVTSVTHAVVGFQRGYCESVNDTLIVNPSAEETSEYFIGNVFEVAVGGIGIYNFNTIVKNYVPVDGSHMRFVHITALGSSTFKGMTVANCRIGHSGYVMGFEATTLDVSDIDMHDITIDNPTGFVRRLSASTPTSLTNCKFEKIGILASYGPLVNLDFTKVFNCSFVLDANINTIGGTNITTDNGNSVIINFVDKSVSNVSRIEYSGGKIRTAYLYVDTDPAGLGSSKWGVLRSAIATIGTILIKSAPSVNGDGTVSMGFVLTSVSGSSVGTTIPYNVGTPSV